MNYDRDQENTIGDWCSLGFIQAAMIAIAILAILKVWVFFYPDVQLDKLEVVNQQGTSNIIVGQKQ